MAFSSTTQAPWAIRTTHRPNPAQTAYLRYKLPGSPPCWPVRWFCVPLKPSPIVGFRRVHHKMAPRIGHMVIAQHRRSRNAEVPVKQGQGVGCRSETSRFEGARVEGWCPLEHYDEFPRFVTSPLSLPVRVMLKTFSPQVKSSDPQGHGWSCSTKRSFYKEHSACRATAQAVRETTAKVVRNPCR